MALQLLAAQEIRRGLSLTCYSTIDCGYFAALFPGSVQNHNLIEKNKVAMPVIVRTDTKILLRLTKKQG